MKKVLILLASILVVTTKLIAQTQERKPFITIWKTDNQGKSKNNQIIFPCTTESDFTIDWEQIDNPKNKGTYKASEFLQPFKDFRFPVLTFPKVGIYKLSILSEIISVSFLQTLDNDKIIDVSQWGTAKWKGMNPGESYNWHYTFGDCTNIDITAVDMPDLSKITTLRACFSNCKNLKGNSSFNEWKLTNVTELQYLFRGASKFNQPIDNWDVSKVEFFNYMFEDATSFNKPLDKWNISSAYSMTGMFSGATSFNQSLNNWNVTKVSTKDMFNGCKILQENKPSAFTGDYVINNKNNSGENKENNSNNNTSSLAFKAKFRQLEEKLADSYNYIGTGFIAGWQSNNGQEMRITDGFEAIAEMKKMLNASNLNSSIKQEIEKNLNINYQNLKNFSDGIAKLRNGETTFYKSGSSISTSIQSAIAGDCTKLYRELHFDKILSSPLN